MSGHRFAAVDHRMATTGKGAHETLEDFFKRCPRLTPGRHEAGVYTKGGPGVITFLPRDTRKQIAVPAR